MVYVTGTNNPAFVKFMKAIGASDLHFGLLGGIPMIMLSFQFLGAAISNVLPKRKPLFMALVIAGRFLYVPAAVVPALFPAMRGGNGIWFVLAMIGLASALMNITGPMWLSWMADLIPRRILNTYWGRRQRWMYLTWTAAFLAVAGYMSLTERDIFSAFPVVAVFAVAAGIIDIVLFAWVREPRNMVIGASPILPTLLAPIANAEYRPFVLYSCAWAASAMFAAAFMQVYALETLGLTVWQTTLVWCTIGLGIAMVSSFWGKLADRHGHRPILIVCMCAKSLVVLAFLLVTPRTALWVLPVMLFADSLMEAGLMVASNGYMLKIAPQRNRSMFIAAITGFAGICGGLGAVLGGAFLKVTSQFAAEFLGRTWTNYSLLFAASILMRTGCLFLALRIWEPKAAAPDKVLQMVRGAWPMRFLLFPVGFYRRKPRRVGLEGGDAP